MLLSSYYHEFRTKKEAKDFAVGKPGVTLFAYDINANGAKKFVAADFDSFCAKYISLALESRKHNEIIPDDVSIKLYIDLEFIRAKENPGLKEDDLVNATIQGIRFLANIETLTPLQLDASNDIKASRHLIFPLVFKNKACVKAFVHKLVDHLRNHGAPETHDGHVCGIDLGVYDKDRCFRLYGSHKFSQPERKLRSLNGNNDDALDHEILRQSMVATFHPDQVLYTNFEEPQQRKRRLDNKKPAENENEEATIDGPIDQRMKVWLLQKYPEARTVDSKRLKDGSLSFGLNPG